MRFNFRKISAIASSVLLTGMTVGIAAAASYPAPFVSGGAADVAVVYGTGAGVSALDQVEATNIQSDLQTGITGGVVSATGGDSYQIAKTNSKMHLGDSIGDVVGLTVDDDELGDLLAQGVYQDANNDEFDYTQEIALADLEVVLFNNNDYARDEPTIGVELASGDHVLNYTLEFTDVPAYADLETTDIVMMGKSYYVLEADNETGLTLLDSAADTVLNEGESQTVLGHDVSISFIGTDEVKLIVDGQTTNALSEGETQKLSDGSYVGIKDILVQDYQGGQKQVEFSIGSGKLVLENGENVQMNDESVDQLLVYISNDNDVNLGSITISWDVDDDAFITETSEITMPGFESVKLSFGGMDFPSEEELMVEPDGDENFVLSDFPMKTSTEDIVFLQFNNSNGNVTVVGTDSDEKLLTSAAKYIVFDADDYTWAVASYNDGDDAESYLIRATNFKTEDDINKTTIQYRKNGAWADAKVDVKNGDDFSIGLIDFDVNVVNKTAKTVNLSTTDTNVNFSILYSEEGMQVELPIMGVDVTVNSSSYDLLFTEEDEDSNIGDGATITATLDTATSDNVTSVVAVTVSAGEDPSSSFELDDSKVYLGYVYSALATELQWDNDPDAKTLKLVYHGAESEAQLFVTAADVTLSGSTGSLIVKDSEVSSMSSKNLIVVGGSCINSVAASLVGGALCGPAFTSATGVGSGQFVIESMASPYSASKVALLVAGYEVADTQAASAYLRTQTVDTSVGKKYIGTSSTSAELVVE